MCRPVERVLGEAQLKNAEAPDVRLRTWRIRKDRGRGCKGVECERGTDLAQ